MLSGVCSCTTSVDVDFPTAFNNLKTADFPLIFILRTRKLGRHISCKCRKIMAGARGRTFEADITYFLRWPYILRIIMTVLFAK